MLLLPSSSLLPGLLSLLSLSCCPVICRIHCCHRHPSQLPLNHHSLLLLPCHCPLPLPLMSTAPAITVLHHRCQTPTPTIATHCHRCQMPCCLMSPCRRHQTPSNSVTAIKHTCSLLPLSITSVKRCCQLRRRQCAVVTLPLSSIATSSLC